jgi:prepilin-type N-terminal cleavage/methylation domain-containing protein
VSAIFRRTRDDAGLTLIEVLVTVAILGIAFVTVIGGMAVSIAGSDVHRKQATSQTILRNLAEFMKAVPYDPSCPADYSGELVDFIDQFDSPMTEPFEAGVSPAADTAYTVELAAPVEVWDSSTPATFSPPAPGCVDGGLQRLTLRVRSVVHSNLEPETLVVVKRQP